MATAYDVPADVLVGRASQALKGREQLRPPEWAAFARTGVHTENPPAEVDWWYGRLAAVLRKTYILGPIGISRLAAEFGGNVDHGSAPSHPAQGSRSIIRTCFKQLEEAGLVSRADTRGRVVTPAGRKFLDGLSHEILTELAAKNPELTKYLRGK